jgi:NDP-sugar pyrophosphorylase family protein
MGAAFTESRLLLHKQQSFKIGSARRKMMNSSSHSSEEFVSTLFNLGGTAHAGLFTDSSRPWKALEVLGNYIASLFSGDFAPGILSEIPGNVHIEGDVWIGPDCKIDEGVFIRGPAWIGKGCEIRQGAYLRGNVLAGDGSVLGHACEFKNCALLEGAQAPHFNYVGDSVLGIGAHIGAGVILSNVRLDKASIRLRLPGSNDAIDTCLAKFGALVGDRCEVGCNSVLNPGTVLGMGSFVLPLSRVKGVWGKGSKI